jgi:hypothetical protein
VERLAAARVGQFAGESSGSSGLRQQLFSQLPLIQFGRHGIECF